jgi:hypothetical protein
MYIQGRRPSIVSDVIYQKRRGSVVSETSSTTSRRSSIAILANSISNFLTAAPAPPKLPDHPDMDEIAEDLAENVAMWKALYTDVVDKLDQAKKKSLALELELEEHTHNRVISPLESPVSCEYNFEPIHGKEVDITGFDFIAFNTKTNAHNIAIIAIAINQKGILLLALGYKVFSMFSQASLGGINSPCSNSSFKSKDKFSS